MAETDLYSPIKRFLEGQGYTVKGEVGECDIVAVRGEEPPVAVELKESLSLALVLQAVDRLTVFERVYIAFGTREGRSAAWRTRPSQVSGLLRRLGLGLLTVSRSGEVRPVLDPAPYRPRTNRTRRERLLREFAERAGDPETGGSAAAPRLTAYRQDAVRCARELADGSMLRPLDLRKRTGIARAGSLLCDNHYGWFERVRPGLYALTPRGHAELPHWLDRLNSDHPL